MRTFLTTASMAALVLVVAPAVRAEDNEDAEIMRMAKEHYKLGLEAFKAGKYPEAIKELKKAYLLKRLPPLLVNIAKTYEKLNDPDNAVYYYKKYLVEAPADAKDREAVQQSLDDIENRKNAPEAGEGNEQPEQMPEAERPKARPAPRPVEEEQPKPAKVKPAPTEAAPTEAAPTEAAPKPAKVKPAPTEAAPTEAAPTEAAPAPKPRPVAPAAAMPTEWSHSPIDSVPPGQPVDVRVQTPVMKGVKVYLYYRSAGQAEFTPVLMKRHGGEKIGRIPADATSGKSMQYYIEAKDPTGNIVKNSGTQVDPNIVMIDPSAPPQLAAGMEEGGAEEPGAAQAPSGEQRRLDEETAPLDRQQVRQHTAPPPTRRRTGPMFDTLGYVGIGVAALGLVVAAVGGSLALHYAQIYSQAVADDACPPTPDGTRGANCPGANKQFYFNDPAASPNDLDFQSRGQLANTMSYVAFPVGGALLAGGIGLVVWDYLKMQKAPPKEKERPGRPSDTGPSPYIPQSSIQNFQLMPTMTANSAGLGASFTF
jgi:hypothetical protein